VQAAGFLPRGRAADFKLEQEGFMDSNHTESRITESIGTDFHYLNCRDCHAEAIFNVRCRTPHAEAQRQIEVENWKRKHVCEVDDAKSLQAA
jgi:hypothetical protein